VNQQPVVAGCHLSSSEDARNASSEGFERKAPELKGDGFSDPGCLTSEDEERETWTAESLRISECLKASAFFFRDRTKDFGGTRFKGYTIVARDVNRRRLVGFG
jgi:hypothetical protein